MSTFRIFLFLAFGAACARLWAQPSLTTIRDTVYRADGKPFNGIALIEWKAFQSPTNDNIAAQGTTARIVNGNLVVRLTPTTGATNAYYLVRYNSDGQFQFSEVWAVPASSAALRLRDVRATLLPGGVVVGGGQGGVVVGETGVLPNFGDSETPAGTIDGTNRFFTLTAAPNPPASLALFRNGLLQIAGNDYLLGGQTITFNPGSTPELGDVLDAFYRTTGTNVATTHNLLSTTHGDTTPGAATRGGLIVGQGQLPSWSLLPLGVAGRCLTSTGLDAIWGPCNYTGFLAGTIPFTDSNGTLAQSASSLTYNNLTRRLSVGNNTPRATLNVHDASSAGTTELVVRAGLSQGAVPMQSWISNAGVSLAFVNADGGFNVQRLIANSTSNRAGFRDPGTLTDPAPPALVDGDTWFNSSTRTRKTYEAGQAHGSLQVICSSVGGANSTIAFTNLGTCTLPAGLLLSGDRLIIEATYMHTGTASDFEIDVRAGGVTIAGRGLPSGDDVVSVEVSIGFGADLAAWSARTVGVVSGVRATVGQAAFVSGQTFGPLTLRGRQLMAGGDNLRLLNFTVRRVPQQLNP